MNPLAKIFVPLVNGVDWDCRDDTVATLKKLVSNEVVTTRDLKFLDSPIPKGSVLVIPGGDFGNQVFSFSPDTIIKIKALLKEGQLNVWGTCAGAYLGSTHFEGRKVDALGLFDLNCYKPHEDPHESFARDAPWLPVAINVAFTHNGEILSFYAIRWGGPKFANQRGDEIPDHSELDTIVAKYRHKHWSSPRENGCHAEEGYGAAAMKTVGLGTALITSYHWEIGVTSAHSYKPDMKKMMEAITARDRETMTEVTRIYCTRLGLTLRVESEDESESVAKAVA